MRQYYLYILSNDANTLVYVGMTNDIARRTYEHKNRITKGFAEKYNINKLVYIEVFDTAEDAISREKQIKHWRRDKKEMLIDTMNPERRDLYYEL